jgi:AcrR family transcriptional regulator
MVDMRVLLPGAEARQLFTDDWRQKTLCGGLAQGHYNPPMADASSLTLARGRPRDPQLEARVFDAAMTIYADAGWAGFNFDAIARAAGVGKASIYRRWSGRGELLRQTFEARWYAVEAIDTGSLRADLLVLARMIARTLTGPYGRAQPRMAVDSAQFPEVRDYFRPYSDAMIRQARGIVRRAIARGELPTGVNPGLLMDLVVGAVTNHVATTPQHLRGAMLDKLNAFTKDLVDTVLRGVGAKEPARGD